MKTIALVFVFLALGVSHPSHAKQEWDTKVFSPGFLARLFGGNGKWEFYENYEAAKNDMPYSKNRENPDRRGFILTKAIPLSQLSKNFRSVDFEPYLDVTLQCPLDADPRFVGVDFAIHPGNGILPNNTWLTASGGGNYVPFYLDDEQKGTAWFARPNNFINKITSNIVKKSDYENEILDPSHSYEEISESDEFSYLLQYGGVGFMVTLEWDDKMLRSFIKQCLRV